MDEKCFICNFSKESKGIGLKSGNVSFCPEKLTKKIFFPLFLSQNIQGNFFNHYLSSNSDKMFCFPGFSRKIAQNFLSHFVLKSSSQKDYFLVASRKIAQDQIDLSLFNSDFLILFRKIAHKIFSPNF